MKIRIVATGSVLIGLFFFAAPRAEACCSVGPPPNESAPFAPRIADQDVIIVWDESARTEHFIRRASFVTGQQNFGFLVPTPTKPELGEVGDSAFDRFTETIKPEEIWVRHYQLRSLLFPRTQDRLRGGVDTLTQGIHESGEPVPPVRVLSEQRVAGFDATVLEADNSEALAGWLKERGYSWRPEMGPWIEPYVAAHWKLTAFKLASNDEGGFDSTRYAVRMSFATDEPFFPYRTPSDRLSANMLRLFFVGPKRVVCDMGGHEWPADVPYAKKLGVLKTVPLLWGVVPGIPRLEGLWLTTFEDREWPRPSEHDLKFSASADQSSKVPLPIVHRSTVNVPIEGVGILGLLPVGAMLLRRSAKRPVSRT